MLLRYHVFRLYWSVICSLIFLTINAPTFFCADRPADNTNRADDDSGISADSRSHGIFADSQQPQENRKETVANKSPAEHSRREQILSPEVLSAFQTHLLAKMGMKERPQKRGQAAPVPDIFRTLYDRLMSGRTTDAVADSNPQPSNENGAAKGAAAEATLDDVQFWDTARGYVADGVNVIMDQEKPSSSYTDAKFELTFNLIAPPRGEEIESAQLALLLTSSGNRHDRHPTPTPVENGKLKSARRANGDHRKEGAYVLVTVSQFVRNHTIIVDARWEPCGAVDRWATFDVASTMRQWLKSTSFSNSSQPEVGRLMGRLSVEVRGTACQVHMGDDSTLTTPAASSLTSDSSATFAAIPSHQRGRLAPSLIVYTATAGKSRTKREAHRTRHNNRHRKNHGKKRTGERQPVCNRRPLSIDFEEVGWNDWIMGPTSYDAFYCAGSCVWPLTHDSNATNHAIMQSLAHSVNPTVPPPSCVPLELGEIQMLYRDEYNIITMKTYFDMIVLSCGCR